MQRQCSLFFLHLRFGKEWKGSCTFIIRMCFWHRQMLLHFEKPQHRHFVQCNSGRGGGGKPTHHVWLYFEYNKAKRTRERKRTTDRPVCWFRTCGFSALHFGFHKYFCVAGIVQPSAALPYRVGPPLRRTISIAGPNNHHQLFDRSFGDDRCVCIPFVRRISLSSL